MYKLVGYAFDAEIHCVDCTRKQFKKMVAAFQNYPEDTDENGIPYNILDSENNPISAIFEDTEFDYEVTFTHCHEENLDVVNLAVMDCYN